MVSEKNALYYGDNLKVLRTYISDESIDLVYLDPPFNSNRDYNVLFTEQTGLPAESQVMAFEDTWKWTDKTHRLWSDFQEDCPNNKLVRTLQGFVDALGHNDLTAYLTNMAPRLHELHRVLKATGSLYLHCDPAASHYLKVVLDMIFGPTQFKNEIIWKRFSGHGNVTKSLGRVHDTILFYSKGEKPVWNQVFRPLKDSYVEGFFTHAEPDGRRYRLQNVLNPNKDRPNLTYEWNGHTRVWKWTKDRMQSAHDEGILVYSQNGLLKGFKQYLDDTKGEKLPDLWDDIKPLGQGDDVALGYPTQKPRALLERILAASSNPGQTVLDPFCGCGTTIMAAHFLGRRWIGIDVTATATSLIKARLEETSGFGLLPRVDYDVHGEPETEADAIRLAQDNKFEFEKWAISLIPKAKPWQEKRGADGGVDGFLRVRMDTLSKDVSFIIISVKGGQTAGPGWTAELIETLDRMNADLGFLVTLVKPTKAMIDRAAAKGYLSVKGVKLPRVQIRTVAQLLRGDRFELPYDSMILGMTKAGEGQAALGI